ncbi:MAG: hypothetical protein ACTS68_01720 [Candidatus Hodgkinia cicadicola]
MLHPADTFTSEAMMQVLTKSLPHHSEEVSRRLSLPPGLRIVIDGGGKSFPSKFNSFSGLAANETVFLSLNQTSKLDSNNITINLWKWY